jgi:hypothetical protein
LGWTGDAKTTGPVGRRRNNLLMPSFRFFDQRATRWL